MHKVNYIDLFLVVKITKDLHNLFDYLCQFIIDE